MIHTYHYTIKRPDNYFLAKRCGLKWTSKMICPKPLTAVFNEVYGRVNVIFDCGSMPGGKK